MNDLTIYDPQNFDTLQRICKAMSESGYFQDARNVAQMIVKVQAGRELGLPPFASVTGLHIIQGKPVLGANVIATLIKNDPRYNYRVLELTDHNCRIEFYENGEACGVSTFNADDAQKAGVKNMNKFPRNMLFARAISNGAKWYTPGIFGGSPVYTPDEMGMDTDEDGYAAAIEGEIVQGKPFPYDQYDIDPGPDIDPMGNHGVLLDKKPKAKPTEKPIDLPAWYKHVLNKIPHYTHQAHINNTLKKLGVEKPATRDEGLQVFDKLKEYAFASDEEQEPLFDEPAASGAYSD